MFQRQIFHSRPELNIVQSCVCTSEHPQIQEDTKAKRNENEEDEEEKEVEVEKRSFLDDLEELCSDEDFVGNVSYQWQNKRLALCPNLVLAT